MKKTNWHGVLENKLESLLNCGLLVRWVPAQSSWECIYACPDEKNLYCIGWVKEKDMEEKILSVDLKDFIDDFMNNCHSNWDEWVDLPMYQKIDDFIGFLGVKSLWKSPDTYYTTLEIFKKLHIKFYFY